MADETRIFCLTCANTGVRTDNGEKCGCGHPVTRQGEEYRVRYVLRLGRDVPLPSDKCDLSYDRQEI